jgi:hypothetical protein
LDGWPDDQICRTIVGFPEPPLVAPKSFKICQLMR